MADEIRDYTEFLQKFYDHGLLREVYRSEKVIVCNVYNQFYAAIDRTLMGKMGEKYKENIPVFIINSKGLQRIIIDDYFVKAFYISLPEEEQKSALKFLDEYLLESWKKRDTVLRQKPVPEQMDLEFEAQLLEQGADVIRAQLLEEIRAKEEAEKPRKRGLFGFFKRR